MEKEVIKNIKSRFFALRNGVVADRLRDAGSPYKIIFGLQIPQLEQIAQKEKPSAELAEELWQNISTRESRLLATMLFPQEQFSLSKANEWVATVDTVELADQLCFRLIRNLRDAESLICCYYAKEPAMMHYIALRLAMNLLVIGKLQDKEAVYKLAELELAKDKRMTKLLCCQIKDEIDWQREEAAFG